jgi:hypothetical protein
MSETEGWRITNDSVMGGKSAGHFILQQNYALFSGNISLENNGGFSSVYRSISPLGEGRWAYLSIKAERKC